MLEIKQVRTAADYESAMARISALLNSEPYSPDDVELDRLSDLVADYEAEHFPIPRPSANGMIEFLADQGILSRQELSSLAGGGDRLDAVLAGKQAVPSELAQVLHGYTGIPVEEIVMDSLAS